MMSSGRSSAAIHSRMAPEWRAGAHGSTRRASAPPGKSRSSSVDASRRGAPPFSVTRRSSTTQCVEESCVERWSRTALSSSTRAPRTTGSEALIVALVFTTSRSPRCRYSGNSRNLACRVSSVSVHETSSRTSSRAIPRASGRSCASSSLGRSKRITSSAIGTLMLPFARSAQRRDRAALPCTAHWASRPRAD